VADSVIPWFAVHDTIVRLIFEV